MVKKFGLTEGFFLISVCLLADVLDFVITFFALDFFGAGEILKIFINIITWATVAIWLKIKGVKQLWFAAGSLLEIIPFINFFPLRTASIIIVIWLTNKT